MESEIDEKNFADNQVVALVHLDSGKVISVPFDYDVN
jgi:hypothetical protein